ncbi:hypothetical protein GCM10009646_23490 [Streptomyces aureus]
MEGDEAREAYGLVHLARAGAVTGEELLHQRREHARRQACAEDCGIHLRAPPKGRETRRFGVARVTFAGLWILPPGDMAHRCFVRY